MRWIKHLTCAARDPKMVQLIAKHGAAGYGMYWMLLEVIAEQVDERGVTELSYPAKHWAKIVGTYQGKGASIFLRSLADLSLISLDIDGDILRVNIPNILKYRDEWSKKKARNSGATPEPLRSKDPDTDSDTELNTICGAPEKSGTPPEPVDEGEVRGTLPLRDGSDFEVRDKYYAELGALFPGLDMRQQFASMKAWLSATPERRKTRRGIKRFVVNWLTRSADRGAGRQRPAKPEYRGGM